MKEFTVKRSKWLRGEHNSCMLRPSDQKMCCLGFCSLALGYTKKDIYERSEPDDMIDKSKYPQNFFDEEYPTASFIIRSIIKVNDSDIILDEVREMLLIEYFTKLDIKIIFED